jgi:hypothetical protein
VRRVEGLQFFEVIEEIAARSACRSLLQDSELEKAQKVGIWGITRLRCRWLSSVENHFIKFAEVLRRENGRSEFSMENSRSPASYQILWSSREVTEYFQRIQAQERQSCRFKPTRAIGFARGFPFLGFVD